MNNDLTSSIVIRKDIFIPSRQEDIVKYYQFLPKVNFYTKKVFGTRCLRNCVQGKDDQSSSFIEGSEDCSKGFIEKSIKSHQLNIDIEKVGPSKYHKTI